MGEREALQRAYREGYARALADVRIRLDEAVSFAMTAGDGERTVALMHARALVRAMQTRAREASHG